VDSAKHCGQTDSDHFIAAGLPVRTIVIDKAKNVMHLPDH